MFSAYLPCVVVEPSHSMAMPGQRRHRRRIAALGGPVAQLVLLEGQPVEPAGDRLLHLRDRRSPRAPGAAAQSPANANHGELSSQT